MHSAGPSARVFSLDCPAVRSCMPSLRGSWTPEKQEVYAISLVRKRRDFVSVWVCDGVDLFVVSLAVQPGQLPRQRLPRPPCLPENHEPDPLAPGDRAGDLLPHPRVLARDESFGIHICVLGIMFERESSTVE